MLHCLGPMRPIAHAWSGGHLRCRCSVRVRCGHLCSRVAGPCGLLLLPCASRAAVWQFNHAACEDVVTGLY